MLSGEGLECPDVQFHPNGYLFLATEKGAEQLVANQKLQLWVIYIFIIYKFKQKYLIYVSFIVFRSLGAKIKLLSVNKLKEKFPWINTKNIELASFGLENEGW